MLHHAPVHLQVLGVDGKMHAPVREAGERPLVLFFITRDCPVCNEYAPEIERIYQRYKSKIVMALVYSDRYVTAASAERHAETYGLSGPDLFLDPKGRFAAACKVGTTPESAVFQNGRESYAGRIDDLFFGYGTHRDHATVHDLRQAIDDTLSHRTVRSAAGPPIGCAIETD